MTHALAGRQPKARGCSKLLGHLKHLISGARPRPSSSTHACSNGTLPDGSGPRTAALRLLRRSELLLLGAALFTTLTIILSFFAGGPGGVPLLSSLRTRSRARAQHVAQELLLRQLVEECSKRQDTVIYVNERGRMVVLDRLPPDAQCPLLDIAFRFSERGVGMCTDAALYVLHARGRIIPVQHGADRELYDARCARRTARLFLETIYPDFLSNGTGTTHIMLANNEHMYNYQSHWHAAMDLFLCKTHFCVQLLKHYIHERRFKAHVWYIGHTSSDPTIHPAHSRRRQRQRYLSALTASSATVAGGGGPSRGVEVAGPGSLQPLEGPDYSQFLHVKGKSGLKHTKQLLECWAQHPEFPKLTVVGDNPYDEAPTQAVLDKPNVVMIPRPLPKQPPVPRKPQPGEEQQDEWEAVEEEGGADDGTPVHVVRKHTDDRLTTFEDIRLLEASIGVHVCPSEREGFGHYLNEARAVGALVITTNHPPMNEFVANNTSGILVAPDNTNSWTEWQAAGGYAHINAFLSTDSVCKGIEQALALSPEQRQRMGAAARRAYIEDHWRFLRKMRFFVQYLELQTGEHNTNIHA